MFSFLFSPFGLVTLAPSLGCTMTHDSCVCGDTGVSKAMAVKEKYNKIIIYVMLMRISDCVLSCVFTKLYFFKPLV
jgi:hypothetical protein